MPQVLQAPNPWYKNSAYWYSMASKYIRSARKREKDVLFKAELDSFREFNTAKVIFESNQIEGAGPPFGETHRLLAEYFPRVPGTFEEFYRTQSKLDFAKLTRDGRILPDVFDALESKGISPSRLIPSISMAKKQRSVREVIQHHVAIQESIRQTWTYIMGLYEHLLGQVIHTVPVPKEDRQQMEELLRESYPNMDDFRQIPKPELLAEESVKSIHRYMAHGILPRDSKVTAGQYRVDNRIVGWDIAFPAPQLVPPAMKAFIRRTDEAMNDCTERRCTMYEAAARISYDFVSIHPFPDFNGRVSRIIMNMVLLARRCPFPIALKGTKKERHRYFLSLKKANDGQLEYLSALIARSVVRTFEDLETHLRKADLAPLISRPLTTS